MKPPYERKWPRQQLRVDRGEAGCMQDFVSLRKITKDKQRLCRANRRGTSHKPVIILDGTEVVWMIHVSSWRAQQRDEGSAREAAKVFQGIVLGDECVARSSNNPLESRSATSCKKGKLGRSPRYSLCLAVLTGGATFSETKKYLGVNMLRTFNLPTTKASRDQESHNQKHRL